ncbi:hypothetical protein [Kingella bonacorsii]|jgi:hypothetical protein|uniref:Uncharacterized protein n=1 Tax=Kingella bonacorsii TaxID=2796361 RepID=A0ABS1BTF9_9NEIS|nr:hypothetical protein [Kingella bonacorsii]MBK0396464.1 hypothetical protein [Kingella bonacorsii]
MTNLTENGFPLSNEQSETTPETPPPAQTIAVANEELNSSFRQQQFDGARIKLFHWAVIGALSTLAILVILLSACIVIYLILAFCQKTTSYFWHIPLMLIFMASTVLSILLTLTAKFGVQHDRDDKENEEKSSFTILTDNIPLKDVIQNLLDKLK